MTKKPVLIILLLLNLAVFVAWQFANTDESFLFMARNFLLSWNSVVGGRPWTLMTSVFSHSSFTHFFLNMMALTSFAGIMLEVLGSRRFVIFYLLAGLSGSFSHIFTSAFLMHDPNMHALGASGAVSGVILLFSLLFPQEKLLILGIIPIRAIWGAIGLMVLDVWGLVTQTQGGGFQIGHGAHLGGSLIGLIYFFILKSKIREQGHQ